MTAYIAHHKPETFFRHSQIVIVVSTNSCSRIRCTPDVKNIGGGYCLWEKTLLNIEGLGRELNPDLDLWKTAKPFLENWMGEQIGFRALFKNLGIKAPMWVEKLPEMPGLVYQTMEQMNKYHRQQTLRDQEIRALREELRASSKRSYHMLLGVLLLFTSGLMSFGETGLSELSFSGWLLSLAGIGLFVYAWPREKRI